MATNALPTCLLDGTLMPLSSARISPFDRGFLFGDGIYEVVPCYSGRPFRLQAHLERFKTGLDALELHNPYPFARWAELVRALIINNGGGDLGIYLQITRGTEHSRDFLPPPGVIPTVFGFCWRLPRLQPEQLERGISVVTLEDIRWQRCDIKAITLLAPVMLRMEAKRRGADEAILIRDGRVAEGSSSAVFVVNGGRIATPPASHERLPSITRLVVGEVLVALGLPLEVREIHRDELHTADEIWLASSTREVMSVTSLDGRALGTGKAGAIWRRVFDEYQAVKKREMV
ncbi:MAG TPA: D-amino acid aminotransferase [Steroidobacteraceae bacterium]|nr:D-amino acid aminotransferase [Steroidobacteraceae bacterium]